MRAQTLKTSNLVTGSAGLATIALLFLTAAAVRPLLDSVKVYQPAFASSDATLEAVNSTPFAQILGEVRASAADLMWIKTEHYLHRGVIYAPHLDQDEM